MRLTLKGLCHCSRWMNCDSHLAILVALNTLLCPMILCPYDSISCLAVGLTSDWGKRTAVGYSSFCLQLPHPRNRGVCRILVNSLSSGISYIVLDVMPVKWQWWSTPLICGFHVNSSSLLPREITMPFVNILLDIGLPSFQFVLYSSLQRLFSLSILQGSPFCGSPCICVFSYTWRNLTGASA